MLGIWSKPFTARLVTEAGFSTNKPTNEHGKNKTKRTRRLLDLHRGRETIWQLRDAL